MAYLLPTFKAVSMIFAISAVATGVQAIVNPIGFSKGFGLPLRSPSTDFTKNDASTSKTTAILQQEHSLTMSYVSLMGVRQLGTGITLLTFAYQNKWTEIATILAIIGIVVAGTDGVYIARGATTQGGIFHAIPGALIAALAGATIYSNP